ncbi:MAG TPA: hypothetical protein VFW16_01975 [Streptosporangiaceae bacterium]|nr:hypothetical protein [Streptosporangiaceae bacterium]
MRRTLAIAVLAGLLASGGLAGCSGGAGGGLPRTSANVAICTAPARVLERKGDVHLLAGLAFESGAPVSHPLRQDIAGYVARAATHSSGARQAAAKAESDCASISAPVAPGFS